jgi:hypothetical protein
VSHQKAALRLTDKDIAWFWKKVAKGSADECWPWLASTTGFGYGQFGAQGRILGAHRVAYFLGYGAWPEIARHNCENPACCNPRHITDPSQPANVVRLPRRELHTQSRHTDDDIRTIRELYAAKKTTQAELASRYGATRE